jgi:4-amino-4-deoxy-L-arabinose transferase-like glycosyltransferase
LGKAGWLLPGAIVFLALVLRLGVIAADSDYVPAHDAFDYDRHGRSIAAGEGFPESGYVEEGGASALRPPVYPYVLGAVYAVSGDSVDAGRIVGAAFGTAAVLLLYLLVLRIWGRRTALVAAFAAAVFPSLVLLSRDLLSEQLFIALELGAVLCVVESRAARRGFGWAATAGLLCGLAALTRNPGAALAIPIVIGLWRRQPGIGWSVVAGPPLVGLLCIFVAMIPWTVRNWDDFGRLVPVSTSSGFGLAGTYNRASMDDRSHPGAWRTPVIVPEYRKLFDVDGVDEGTLDATLRSESAAFAWDHPGYALETSGRNLLRLFELSADSVVGRQSVLVAQRGIGSNVSFSERISLAIAAVFAVLGGALLVRRHYPRGPLFLWLVPVLTVLVAAPIAGLPRYRVPADPFLLILAALGLIWAWEEAGRRWRTG